MQQEELNEILERIIPKALSCLIKQGKDEYLAEEVLQDAILKLIDKINKGEMRRLKEELSDKEKELVIYSWVIRTARGKMSDFWKKKKVKTEAIYENIEDDNQPENLESQELQTIMEQTVKEESFYTKAELLVAKIFIRQAIDGVEYGQILENIGKEIGISTDYARRIVHVIRKKLGERIKQRGYR